MTRTFKLLTIFAVASILTGCGGGNNPTQATPPPGSDTPINDPNATGPSPLSGGTVDTGGSGITLASGGIYDHDTNSYSIGGDSGTVDFVGGNGTINGGGSVSVFGLQTFVAGVTAQPNGSQTQIGYVGVPTFAADMANAPATATYNGVSKMLINDGTATWALDGTATATMDFTAGSGSGSIANLDGTRTANTGGTTAVTDVATIGLNNLLISGNGFSGNSIAINSNQLGAIVTGNATVDVQGGFFGSQALDIGGAIFVDDTANGTMTIHGAFTGAR